jgi:hypothetical protein
MAFKQLSAVAAGHQAPINPGGSELVRSRFGQPLAVADHAIGARGVIDILPAGTLPVSLFIRVPAALGAGFKASIGLADAGGDISAAADDGGGAWVTDNDAGAAGGYVHLVPAAFAKLVPKDEDRRIVLKITGAGTAAGLFALDLIYTNA